MDWDGYRYWCDIGDVGVVITLTGTCLKERWNIHPVPDQLPASVERVLEREAEALLRAAGAGSGERWCVNIDTAKAEKLTTTDPTTTSRQAGKPCPCDACKNTTSGQKGSPRYCSQCGRRIARVGAPRPRNSLRTQFTLTLPAYCDCCGNPGHSGDCPQDREGDCPRPASTSVAGQPVGNGPRRI